MPTEEGRTPTMRGERQLRRGERQLRRGKHQLRRGKRQLRRGERQLRRGECQLLSFMSFIPLLYILLFSCSPNYTFGDQVIMAAEIFIT